MSAQHQFGNLTLTLYDDETSDVERQCKLLDVYAKTRTTSITRAAVRRCGIDSDRAYEREMGAWTRAYDEQFAYTGGRKGDKDLLAALVDGGYEQLSVAA